MLNKRALLAVIFCSFAFLVPSLYGQATASFSGTVSDKAGAVVSGATITATSQATGLSRESKTDDLIPATFSAAMMTGFKSYLLPVAFYTCNWSPHPGFQTAYTDNPCQQRKMLLCRWTGGHAP